MPFLTTYSLTSEVLQSFFSVSFYTLDHQTVLYSIGKFETELKGPTTGKELCELAQMGASGGKVDYVDYAQICIVQGSFIPFDICL